MTRTLGAATAASGWTRRSYLVDRGFQLKYAIGMAAAAALVAVVLGFWLQRSHALAMAGAGVDYVARRAAEASYRVLFTIFVGAAAAVAVGVGAISVLITHRVAGPALVIRRYLASLGKGRYPRLRSLRRGDELGELFVTVADAVERLRRRDVQQVELLEEVLASLRHAAIRPPEVGEAIALLEREVAERRAVLEAGG